jgi:HAD superfamily hydrolase (TIGR01457 family)
MSSDPLLEVLANRRAFLVDLDGVVYEGARAIRGAKEFFAHLRAQGMPFQLITNNSTRTASDVALHLQHLDMPVTEEDVLTSPEATAIHVETTCGKGACIYVIGEDGLVRTLVAHGFKLTTDPDRATAVVCGLDRRLTYDRLRRACAALQRGIPLVATNPDRALPTETGFLPGNGATLAYLQVATGVTAVVIGKPSPTMLQIAMSRMGTFPSDTVMIGDGLDTDILAGARASVATILVLSGVARASDVAHATAAPDAVVESIETVWQRLADPRSRSPHRSARKPLIY